MQGEEFPKRLRLLVPYDLSMMKLDDVLKWEYVPSSGRFYVNTRVVDDRVVVDHYTLDTVAGRG